MIVCVIGGLEKGRQSILNLPALAIRPADSRLDCESLEVDFGLSLRPWQSAVNDIVDNIAQELRRK